jgi:hypothetical protein
MRYKLAEGVKMQSLAVHVPERRPGLPYAVTVRKDVLIRPGEVVDTDLDLSPWIKEGLVVEVFDAAAKFKAALPVAEPLPAPVPEPGPAEEPEAPSAEPEASGEGGDAAPLAKAAARAARRGR